MERMEARQFRSLASWTANTISDLSGDFFGSAMFGDNGDLYGIATSTAGIASTEHVSLFAMWDSDYEDGVNSLSRSVSLSLNRTANGAASWSCQGGGSGTFTVGTDLSISSVTIRAAVLEDGMRMEWNTLAVSFYDGGVRGESVYILNIVADTMNTSNNAPLESVVIVTPEGTSYDGVVVSGRVKLQAEVGVYPAADDLFGQIFIN